MQRDMDLFREILLSIEEAPSGNYWTAIPLGGHSIEDVVGHLRLIDDAGFVEARFLTTMDNDGAIVIRMTNAGHDFLEASKQPTMWEQAKAQIKSGGLPMTISVIREVFESLIKAHLPH